MMEQLCFLNDFPASEEERLYKLLGNDASGDYKVYTGGTYVCIKNKKGLTIRFTSSEIKAGLVGIDQIEAWVYQLHQLHANF